MVDFFKRFGMTLVGTVIGAVAQTFAAQDWTELGIYAGVASAVAALIVTFLQKLAAKVVM